VTPLAQLAALPVRAYRTVLSPWVGHSCRFQPTCSTYALEALEAHGAFRGSWLTLRRIARCHPWGASGIDNVPSATRDRTPVARSARRGESAPSGRVETAPGCEVETAPGGEVGSAASRKGVR
jgi:uncharacterized protein